MRRFILAALFIVLTAVPAGVAQTAAVRTVAIADFIDASNDGWAIGANRLNSVLERLIIQRAGGSMHVIASEQVRVAMKVHGATAHDLISPSKAIAVAQAIGAEWIVTGRWTHLDIDYITRPSPADPTREIVILVNGTGLLELRVLEAATRRIVLQDSVGGYGLGSSRFGALVHAAQVTLLRAADRIIKL